MDRIDEHLERLICRSLDRALSDDEQLALDRELIRNPDARALMTEYEANDRLAAAALDRALGAGASPVAVRLTGRSEGRAPRRWVSTARWLVPGAIAAALLAMVVPRPWEFRPVTPRVAQVVAPPNEISPGVRASDGMMHSVGTAPSIHRDKGREVIGVVGEDGNLYWIEVERTRTVRSPSRERAGAVDDL